MHLHSHFCPSCGEALIPGMCPVEKRGFLSRYRLCPNCSVRAERSGGLFIVFGLALAVAGSFVMPFDALAAVVGFGMCVFGVLRLSRQFAAHRRWLRSQEAEPGVPACGSLGATGGKPGITSDEASEG